jgi:hypothetical protein
MASSSSSDQVLGLGNEVDSQTARQALSEKAELPLIVIVSVSVCGTVLLVLNIAVFSCLAYKRRQKERLLQKRAPSSEGNRDTTENSLTSVVAWL